MKAKPYKNYIISGTFNFDVQASSEEEAMEEVNDILYLSNTEYEIIEEE